MFVYYSFFILLRGFSSAQLLWFIRCFLNHLPFCVSLYMTHLPSWECSLLMNYYFILATCFIDACHYLILSIGKRFWGYLFPLKFNNFLIKIRPFWMLEFLETRFIKEEGVLIDWLSSKTQDVSKIDGSSSFFFI